MFANKNAHGCKVEAGETSCAVKLPSDLNYQVDIINLGSEMAHVNVDASKYTAPPKKGGWSKKLRKYHYMMFMPYFDDPLELGTFENQTQALEKILANLNKGAAGTQLVYRVDIPNKAETVIGVGIKEGLGSDSTVINITDTGGRKHSAHLPYEILVSNGKVFALHAKFRIAQSFPDLTMGTFMKISDAPDAIEETLGALTK